MEINRQQTIAFAVRSVEYSQYLWTTINCEPQIESFEN